MRITNGRGLAPRRLPVSLVLLLFAWRHVAIDEQIFGAEQSHPFGAAGLTASASFGPSMLRREHAMAIQRYGGLELDIAQFFLEVTCFLMSWPYSKRVWSVGLR